MLVNEMPFAWHEGLTLAEVRAALKPEADIVIHNSFPCDEAEWQTTILDESDEVVLIQRGETPEPEEMKALLRARHTPGVAEKLEKACVGIAGLGGLGSHVALALARIGIGRLILVDFDVVEPSNLNRQAYSLSHLGCTKAAAVKEQIVGLSLVTRADACPLRLTEENVAETFSGCDVITECFDRPEEKQMLVETVLRKMPLSVIVAASGLAGTAESNLIRTRKISSRFWLVGDEENAAQKGTGLMAPRVMVAAGHQANLVVRIILGMEENNA